MSAARVSGFAANLVAWHKEQGRHDLPWQKTHDPYAIWVSEIMLQQTQVATVIPYYRRFMERFPDIETLSAAPLDEVLVLWSGLGYYARARNLHGAAQLIVREHGGCFPRDMDRVVSLPGIGRSTAAAICAFAYGDRHAILDGNVKRVLARHFGIHGYPGHKRIEAALWDKAESLLPRKHIAAYTQALMDLGAGLCTRRRPRCIACPVVPECVAYRQGLTEVLPAPRPKMALPRRKTVMLVIEDAGKLLFEKRPAAGIWGSLWCFPEFASNDDYGAECKRRFGAHVARNVRLPSIEHGFTHFRLTIEPRHVRVSRLLPRAAEPGLVWMSVEKALAAAVPTPVRRILLELQKQLNRRQSR